MKKLFLLLAVAMLFAACNNVNNENDSIDSANGNEFSITEYSETDFKLTPQDKISDTANSIYCVTMLYAWNENRVMHQEEIDVEEKFKDLFLLNASESYKNALNEDEYSTSVEFEKVEFNTFEITITTEFFKTLVFEPEFTEMHSGINFNDEKVAAFGSWGDNPDHRDLFKILYYKDDNNFIVSLLPTEKEHEIILYKTENRFETLDAAINEMQTNIDFGISDIKNNADNYIMKEEDILKIPVFDFNIENFFPKITGNYFYVLEMYHKIIKAKQRIALSLNHKGAIIESVVIMEEEIIEEALFEEEEEIIIPKLLIFDDEFLIIMRKVDSDNPYFAMWTKNAELMLKEE